MDKQNWNYQQWIMNRIYPSGAKLWFSILSIVSILLLFVIFCYHYPVYQTFYGTVKEDNEKLVNVMVPLMQIEEFERAIVNNKDMELKKVDSEIQDIAGEKVISAEVIVSIDQKLLVENNVVVIRVKTKNISIWNEISQKWKRGMNDEKNES